MIVDIILAGAAIVTLIAAVYKRRSRSTKKGEGPTAPTETNDHFYTRPLSARTTSGPVKPAGALPLTYVPRASYIPPTPVYKYREEAPTQPHQSSGAGSFVAGAVAGAVVDEIVHSVFDDSDSKRASLSFDSTPTSSFFGGGGESGGGGASGSWSNSSDSSSSDYDSSSY